MNYFGLTTAGNWVLTPDDTDAQGHPVFTRSSGFGFFIVIEVKKGLSGGLPVFPNPNLSDPPDIQIEANQALGNGSLAVCDVGPLPALLGGVPGVNPPNFDPSSQFIVNALNDFGCRFYDNTVYPCTYVDDSGIAKKVMADSDKQYCTQRVVGAEMAFAPGDTLLTVQLSDSAGNIGYPASMVIRVPTPLRTNPPTSTSPPTLTPTVTRTRTSTGTPTVTGTPTITSTPVPSSTPTNTPPPTVTATRTPTPVPSATVTPSATLSGTPTATLTPSATATSAGAETATATATDTPGG